MSSIVQNQKEDIVQESKKQRLIREINQTKIRIAHYKQLENQIQSVSGLIKSQKQKSNKLIKQDQSQNPKRNSNTNKKIKIYQLQKKLQARKKQYKDQHVIYLGKYKKQQEMLTEISNTNKQIRQQKDYSKQLQRLTISLQDDIYRIQQTYIQNKNLLINEKEILQMYLKQKVKHIQQIKRLKKKIRKSSQNTEPDDDLALSLDEQQDIPKPLDFDVKYQSPRFPSTHQKSIFFNTSKYKQKQNFEKDECLMNQSPVERREGVTFQQQYHNSSWNPYNSKQTNKSQTIKNNTQIHYQIDIQQDRLDKNNKMFDSLLESISLVKRGNKNLQASIKHSAVTLDLLKMRMVAAENNNKLECEQILRNTDQSDKLYKKLRNKQGERGQIRGKLGMKVQNTRILGIINQQINFDLQKLTSKMSKLRSSSLQCKEIVQKFYNIFSTNTKDMYQKNPQQQRII